MRGLCSEDLWARKLGAVRAYSPPVKTKRRPEKEFGELITVLHGGKEQPRDDIQYWKFQLAQTIFCRTIPGVM